jgi:hypothetical protein
MLGRRIKKLQGKAMAEVQNSCICQTEMIVKYKHKKARKQAKTQSQELG